MFDIVRKDSFGDVIHSEPAVVFYSNGADGQPDTADDDVKIFVGTNDGQLHCIDDATGNEVWSFVPPDQLGRLLLLSDNAPDHEYFVDGSPTVYYGSNQKILVIGSRRGGSPIRLWTSPTTMHRGIFTASVRMCSVRHPPRMSD